MAGTRRKSKGSRIPGLDWPRLRRWSLAIGLFALMGGAASWGVLRLGDPRVLPLKVVRIDGRLQYLDRADIERAVGAVVRGNFFTLDVTAVRAAARKLPWVDQVSVRRLWPDTLRMQVLEQVIFARWGERQLVNPRGDVFEPAPQQIPEGLPTLHGPEGSGSRVVQRFRDMRTRLAPLGLEIEQLTQDARGAWRLVFRQGLELALGNADTERRLQRFVQIYPRLRDQQGRQLKRIDLRYTNGFAVHWEPVAAGLGNDQTSAAGNGAQQGATRHGRGRV